LVNGDKGLNTLKVLLDTYFENGGMQIQLSIADTKLLKQAQLKPDEYKDLMVRITGYSAVFTDMSKKGQDEIIRRDEI
jgi:formate C-acetyltransferase